MSDKPTETVEAVKKEVKAKEPRSVKERVLLRVAHAKALADAVAGLVKTGVWVINGEMTFNESKRLFEQDLVRTKDYILEKRIEQRRKGTSGASVIVDVEVIQPIEEKHEEFNRITSCCDVIR